MSHCYPNFKRLHRKLPTAQSKVLLYHYKIVEPGNTELEAANQESDLGIARNCSNVKDYSVSGSDAKVKLCATDCQEQD